MTNSKINEKDLQKLPNHLRYDVVKGVLHTSPIFEGLTRSWIANYLHRIITDFVQQHHIHALFGINQLFILSKKPDGSVAEARTLNFGLALVGNHAEIKQTQNIIPHVPDIAVIIISPSETTVSMLEQVATLLRVGTQEVWVIYSWKHQEFHIYRENDILRVHHDKETVSIQTVLEGLKIDLRELYHVDSPYNAVPLSNPNIKEIMRELVQSLVDGKYEVMEKNGKLHPDWEVTEERIRTYAGTITMPPYHAFDTVLYYDEKFHNSEYVRSYVVEMFLWFDNTESDLMIVVDINQKPNNTYDYIIYDVRVP